MSRTMIGTCSLSAGLAFATLAVLVLITARPAPASGGLGGQNPTPTPTPTPAPVTYCQYKVASIVSGDASIMPLHTVLCYDCYTRRLGMCDPVGPLEQYTFTSGGQSVTVRLKIESNECLTCPEAGVVMGRRIY